MTIKERQGETLANYGIAAPQPMPTQTAPPAPPFHNESQTPMPEKVGNATVPRSERNLESLRIYDGFASGQCPHCGADIRFPYQQDGCRCKSCKSIVAVDYEATLALENHDAELMVYSFMPQEAVKVYSTDLAGHILDGKIYIGEDTAMLDVKLSMATINFKKKRRRIRTIDIATIRGYDSIINPLMAQGLGQLLDFDIPVIGELVQKGIKFVGDTIANVLRYRLYFVEDAQGVTPLICIMGKSEKSIGMLESRRKALYQRAGLPAPALERCDDTSRKIIARF